MLRVLIIEDSVISVSWQSAGIMLGDVEENIKIIKKKKFKFVHS